MNEFPNKVFRAKRAATVLFIIGVLCINIDFYVRTNWAYPNYTFVENSGFQTQRMIMEDVVGTRVKIDLGSELLGFLCLAACLLVVRTYAKPELPLKKELRKMASKFGWLMPRAKARYIAIPLLGAVMYAAARLLPFFTNGLYLYGPEFFINFGLAVVSVAALMFTSLCYLRECDRFQNHKETEVIYLFVFLAAFTGFLKDLAAFYGTTGVELVYMILNMAFTIALCSLVIHYVHTEETVAKKAALDPSVYGIETPPEGTGASGEDSDSPIYFKS
ncbi:MAG: hypothetical protein J6Y10_09130 [Lachnospiraceae bacterium]|nr:hypothetical protein [Lachnospiraceae bacterium]